MHRNGEDKKKKIHRRKKSFVIQTLSNIPHPLKTLCISKSTLVTTNPSTFPKASKKALGYCSDSVSAEDQLSVKATGKLWF